MTESTGVLRPLPTGGHTRRHDLDALRAFAMLLGIALHGALTFMDIPWVVQDRSREPGLGLLVLLIHGFRMPVFFLLSGFFAAMLLRRYGLGGLLRHRARRIALPLALSCLTILPLTWLAMGWATSKESVPAAVTRDVWTAAAQGDLATLRAHVEEGGSLEDADPFFGHTPLAWAVLGRQEKTLDVLLATGVDPSARYRDENTALHTAAFFGRAEAARRLLEAGADVTARNVQGETPLDSLRHDRATTELIAGLLHTPVDMAVVEAGRDDIRRMLVERRAPSGLGLEQETPSRASEESPAAPGRSLRWLTERPFFHHLWFLWFLCWLLAGFAVAVLVLRRLPRVRIPPALVATPLCLLWLVPLTMLAQSAMHGGGALPGFGADDSTGLLPQPHVLAYYAIFFGFGALMFSVPRAAERLGRGWWLQLALVALVTPVTLVLALRMPVGHDMVADEGLRRFLANLGQVLFAWLMAFGLMGLFQRVLGRERPGVRYVSDSSYWVYLVHLPLIIVAQVLLRDIALPATTKFTILVVVSTAVLIASYQVFVRHTWIGRLLNGPRTRHTRPVRDASRATVQHLSRETCE